MARLRRNSWLWLGLGMLVTLAAIVAAMAFIPLEKTLGERIRIVYLHGAWVWAGKLAFGLAALAGLAGLLTRARRWLDASWALGWTGLFFWLTYLPMSVYVMQVNWGGVFWDEPRWRIPLTFGVVGLLLQLGLWIMRERWLTGAANLVYGAGLWWALNQAENVLHPDSPVYQSGSQRIEGSFSALLVLAVLLAAQLAWALYRWLARRS